MSNPPKGLFEGVNFMTPEIIDYFDLNDGGKWAELSSGRGMNNQKIFGVTVRPKPADRADDVSKMCATLSDAMHYIDQLTNYGDEEDHSDE